MPPPPKGVTLDDDDDDDLVFVAPNQNTRSNICDAIPLLVRQPFMKPSCLLLRVCVLSGICFCDDCVSLVAVYVIIFLLTICFVVMRAHKGSPPPTSSIALQK